MLAVNPLFSISTCSRFCTASRTAPGICLTWNALKINYFSYKRQTPLNSQANILVLPWTGDLLVKHQLDQRYSWAFIGYNKTSLSHEDTQHSLPAHSSCLNPALWIKYPVMFFLHLASLSRSSTQPRFTLDSRRTSTHTHAYKSCKARGLIPQVWWSEAR